MKNLIGQEHLINIQYSMWSWHDNFAKYVVDVVFIMSTLKSALFPSPLSVLERGVFLCRLFKKCINKTIIEFDFYMISWIIKPPLCQISHTSVLIIHDIILNLL